MGLRGQLVWESVTGRPCNAGLNRKHVLVGLGGAIKAEQWGAGTGGDEIVAGTVWWWGGGGDYQCSRKQNCFSWLFNHGQGQRSTSWVGYLVRGDN